ncbi:MAG TPA: antitoxin [Steroidobacteraceae bacterium]
MATTTLRKVGGSVMLAVPPAMLDSLRLVPGSKVNLSVEDGRLVVGPQARLHYTLAQLLAQSDYSHGPTAEDERWTNGGSVGEELL